MIPTRKLRDNSVLAGVIAIGVVLSLVAFVTVRNHARDQVSVQFDIQARDYANSIVDGLSQAIYSIESVAAFYYTTTTVSPAQFADFSAPLLNRHPTISALGWAPRVARADRDLFEREAQRDFPGFRITEIGPDKSLVPATAKPVHFPILQIQPFELNETAHGFDLYSNPIRRAAIDGAIKSGRTTSTARIRLVQERGHQFSVLLISPVFERNDSGPVGGEVRGVASAVYRIGDGVERSLRGLRSLDLTLWLFDRSAERDQQYLYFHHAGQNPDEYPETPSAPPLGGVNHSHRFNLAERQFELVLAPANDDFGRNEGYLAWPILLGGLLFTGLLAGYIRLMVRRSNDLLRGSDALRSQVDETKLAEQRLRLANQELEVLSRKDPLMGIANRRRFDEYIELEWARAIRQKMPLSLLIADIDHFKSYNDTHGHIAGDECLRRIATVLHEAAERPGDLVARYGGEEIAFVLPSTPMEGARMLAERVLVLVSSMSPAVRDAGQVTMSVGFGTIEPARDTSMKAFIKAVDEAMYCAKKAGRNQAVSTEESRQEQG